jgi:hypothetical protein
MNIHQKLQLIQEGYSIDQINSGQVNPFHITHDPSMDGIDLMTESIISDMNFITEMSLDLMREADGEGAFKRFINWVIQRITQFKDFIANLFSKSNKQADEKAENISKAKTDKFTPFKVTVPEKMVSDPDKVISEITGIMGKYRDQIDQLITNADKGFEYNKIPVNMEDSDFRGIIWKRVIDNSAIKYDDHVIQNIIDHLIGKPVEVTISTSQQVENVVKFHKGFYTVYKMMDTWLEKYREALRNMKFPKSLEDTTRIVNLANSSAIISIRGLIGVMTKYSNTLLDTTDSHLGTSNRE